MLFAVLLLLLAPALSGCSRDTEITPPSPPGDTTGQRAAQAQETLDRLVGALQARDPRAASALAPARSRRLLGELAGNARELRVDRLSMRYVDEAAPLPAADLARYGQDAWRATVQLTYGYAGYDSGPARLETEVVLVPGGQGVQVARFGGGSVRSPLWLLEPLSVVRTGRTLVAVAGPSAGRYPGLVARAARQVGRLLPAWRGPLLVEVPRTGAELTSVLHAEAGEYDNIAAVTTTADGSQRRTAPVRVFVNPAVFEDLKERGAQVVMSHEATHVATGATFVSMPTWLLEGFADFVALDDAGVPVQLAARQILSRIRTDGLPTRLPTADDLDPTANGLGATYEEAWLACRFLAQEYGAQRLVRFYDSVSGGTPVQRAFRDVLGTSQAEFLTRWRGDLAGLAGVAG